MQNASSIPTCKMSPWLSGPTLELFIRPVGQTSFLLCSRSRGSLYALFSKAATQGFTVPWDTGRKRKGALMQEKVICINSLASNQLSLLYLEHCLWLLTIFRITKLKAKLVYLAFGAFVPPCYLQASHDLAHKLLSALHFQRND